LRGFREIARIAAAFVGIIVGAGFASGQEIVQFFSSFGITGLAGVAFSTILFTLFAAALSGLGHHFNAASHKDALYAISGYPASVFLDALITIFMLAVLVIMFAGGSALVEQLSGVPAIWGALLITAISVLIVWLGLQKLITIICCVTPLMVLLVVIVASTAFPGMTDSAGAMERAALKLPAASNHWFLASVLYVSFNIVAGAPFLIIMGSRATSRRVALRGGMLGGILLGLLMLLLAASFYVRASEIAEVPLPSLYLAMRASPVFGFLMAFVIFASILNTAVGVLYSFAARLSETSPSRFRPASAVGAALAFGGSLLGFTQLINKIYPFFGYLGLVLMVWILFAWFRFRPWRATGTQECEAPNAAL